MAIPILNNLFQKPLDIKNNVYAMASTGKDSAELTFYGDVVNEVPTDWWTGERLEGNYIILDDFIKDLDRLAGYKNINIRMNSYGGDCVAAFAIHNRLRELSRDGKNITCIVDGVAMSAASLIMCACDTVKVNPASLIMIHKCWSPVIGYYNADELADLAKQNAEYDKAIASTYARKTGLSETQILHMMADTTYMTGKEAVDKGFADELIEDAEPVQIAASADGKSLFCGGREIHLAPGMVAPDFIPKQDPQTDPNNKVTPAPKGADNNAQPDVTGQTTKEVVQMTKDELRAQYPDLVAEVEADAQSGNAEAVQDAVNAERQRLSEIDEIASLYPEDAVRDAKYGENACSASELALRMAKENAKKGASFLDSLHQDSQTSGANGVPSAAANPAEDQTGKEDHEASPKEAADYFHKIFNGGKEAK